MKSEKFVDSGMTSAPVLATRLMSVDKALRALKAGAFRHLPVVEDGEVVGIVSDRDLRQALSLANRIELTVGDVMTEKPYSVAAETPLVEVVKEMNLHKYGCAVILGKKGQITGIFTRADAMRILVELLETDSHSAIRKLSIEKYLSPSYLI